jgi:hypothetical protein
VGRLLNPNSLIVSTKMNEAIIVILHTMQMTQTLKLLEDQPKGILDISCDHLRPSVPSYFLSMPCICDEEWQLLDNRGILSLLTIVSKKEIS